MNARLTLIASLVLSIASIGALITLHLSGVTAMLVGIAASISIALFALTLMTQSWSRSDRRASAASSSPAVDDIAGEHEPAALAG